MYGAPAYWIYGFANSTIKEFAEYMRIPVINMECDKFHPTQALADMITIKEKFGGFKGLKFVMSWAYSGSTHKPLAVPRGFKTEVAERRFCHQPPSDEGICRAGIFYFPSLGAPALTADRISVIP